MTPPDFLSTMRRAFYLLPILALLFPSCRSTGESPALAARLAAIRAEPAGDYWIGRRYFVTGPQGTTRFWGYVRRPGQAWEKAKLVIIDESIRKTPDRLPAAPEHGPAHGYDQNYEYRIAGHFPGHECYDPNSDLVLPVFRATHFELITPQPGFLFTPSDAQDRRNYIPAREAKYTTPQRM